MGRDIIAAGVLGTLAVIAVTLGYQWIERAAGWPRRYVRARGYEHELARHTARALLEDIEPLATYATVTIPRTETRGDPPAGLFPDLEPRWASDIEREGGTLPGWAAPDADRSSAYGLNSGSSGSDYHGGELPTAGEGGARRLSGMGTRAAGGPASESFGATAPAPAILIRHIPHAPELYCPDCAQDKAWARLLEAWAPEGSADSGNPPGPANGTPEPTAGPGWAPTRLGTLFDACLAAEASAYIQDQNREVTLYLERLLGIRW